MSEKKVKAQEKIDIGTPETLASEMYRELKRANIFKEKVIISLCIVIALLIVSITGLSIYHIHQWSQFDTVVVDTDEGGGNANYVQGDNQGGIFNGEGYSSQAQEGQVQGDQDKA